jgi:transmembrane sensor
MSRHRTHSASKAAARWYLKQADGAMTPGDTEDFTRWLALDARHADAYRRLAKAMGDVDHAAGSPHLADLRQEARRRAMIRPMRRAPQALAAALILGLLLPGALTYWRSFHGASQQFASGVGQRRQITLQDGSRLSLDSDSVVEVNFRSTARSLTLVRGQARFQVAHDASRPFTVAVAGQRVVATGTDFTVERLSAQTIVTLLTGGVAVEPNRADSLWDRVLPRRLANAAVRLRPRRQLVITDAGTARIGPINPANAISWESGMLTFNSEPLSTAAERFNRSNSLKLRVADQAVGHIRVSGTFPVSDPATFAMAVGRLHHVAVNASGPRILYLGRARATASE